MIKKMTCIQCPKGCSLSVDIENCRVVRVSGNLCPKGEEYARSEVEDPRRVLTATVLAEGLSLKMVPVRTNRSIPKAKIQEAAAAIRKLRVRRPLAAGDVVAADLLGLGADLVATRGAKELKLSPLSS